MFSTAIPAHVPVHIVNKKRTSPSGAAAGVEALLGKKRTLDNAKNSDEDDIDNNILQVEEGGPILVSFEADLTALQKFFTWQEDVDRAKSYTPLVNKYYEPSIYRMEEVSGEEMLLKVQQTVNSFFPTGRFHFQVKLHEQILRATLKQTLGEDYERSVDRVCHEHGWAGPKRNLFAIASRRSGKTTATASMVAALLICIPNIQIVVYSVALRTAQEFVRLTERYIQMSDVGKDMIKNPGGSETLILNGKSLGDMRRIRSFPSGGNAKNVSLFFRFLHIPYDLTKKFSCMAVAHTPPAAIEVKKFSSLTQVS